MAKSLRSKWRRKCRAVKRVRYGQKELERLKTTLGLDGSKSDTTELVQVATVSKPKDVKPQDEKVEDNEMETDKPKRIFNTKTMKDQNGAFPIWMNQRKIHKKSSAIRKKKATAAKKAKNKKR